MLKVSITEKDNIKQKELTNDIVNKIDEILNKEVKIKHVEDRLGHDRVYSLDCNKLYSFYLKRNKEQPTYLNLFDYLKKQYGS